MKKTLTLIFLFLLICGCDNNSSKKVIKSDYNTNETNYITIRKENRNNNAIKIIQEYLMNTSDINYSFNYDITIDNNKYNYHGEKYQDTIKGIYNNKYDYQIENNKFYNPTTNEEIESIYYDINADLINISTYTNLLTKDYICTTNNNTGICEYLFKDINITFYFEDDYINNIIYNENNIKYDLLFSNYSDIDPIPLVDYENYDINFNRTKSIKKITVTKDVDEPYTVYNYYIDNATINIDNKKVPIIGNREIFNNPMYYLNFNNIINKDEVKNVEEYIYNDDFIMIIINENIYYLSTTDYEDEILAKYIEN